MNSKDSVVPNGKRYDWREDTTLNSLQQAHIRGELNLYATVESYTERWFHKGDEWYPLPNTRIREDLPPLYIQWKDSYRTQQRRLNARRNK